MAKFEKLSQVVISRDVFSLLMSFKCVSPSYSYKNDKRGEVNIELRNGSFLRFPMIILDDESPEEIMKMLEVEK